MPSCRIKSYRTNVPEFRPICIFLPIQSNLLLGIKYDNLKKIIKTYKNL